MRLIVLLVVGVWGMRLALRSGDAIAHPAAEHGSWWTWDPFVWLPLVILCVAYARGVTVSRPVRTRSATRRNTLFCLAIGTLVLALVWPLDALAEASLAAHMAQHMVLIAVAAPLLVFARPAGVLAAALPQGASKYARWLLRTSHAFVQPRLAFALHTAAIWLGHAPQVIDWTLASRALHTADHLVLLGSALLFWSALAAPRRRAEAALLAFATMCHTGVLGALLTFAPRPLYDGYAARAATPLADQQLAGLIMWVPGGALYLVAGLFFAAAWLQRSEPRSAGAAADRPAKASR